MLILTQHTVVPVLQSYILEPFAILSILIFTYFNHTRTRAASNFLLIFWPFYTLASAIWTRTIASKDVNSAVTIVSLKLTALGLALISYAFECLGSEIDPPADKVVKENPVITANIYSIWVGPNLLESMFVYAI